jgi:hypothetical protein
VALFSFDPLLALSQSILFDAGARFDCSDPDPQTHCPLCVQQKRFDSRHGCMSNVPNLGLLGSRLGGQQSIVFERIPGRPTVTVGFGLSGHGGCDSGGTKESE